MTPVMLFKSPGVYRVGGKTYAVCSVTTKEELAEQLANGWYQNREEAIAAAGDAANVPEKKKPRVLLKKKPQPISTPAPVKAPQIQPLKDEAVVELGWTARAMLYASKLKQFFWS